MGKKVQEYGDGYVNLLEIKNLQNGQIQVSWQGADTRKCPSIPFSNPLTAEDRRELRWYLEEYLQFPYGAERDHARTVEKKMAEWGESLFQQVFPQCDFYPDPQLLYHEAVREGLDTCELCITSDSTDFLDIPWELLKDPTPGRGFLAPLLGGLYRKRESHKIMTPSRSEGPFRILLVIARPFGEKDVPLQTVARPVLETLRPLRKCIELEVLRPPTFDKLVEKLHNQRGYYDVVHFDGHGVFGKSSGSFMFGGGSGFLVFEKDDGTEHVVSSEELGQELATCKVPLFVLNACQSAQEGGENPYSSVASQLVAVGAKGVVAMFYSVYSTAAAKFMQRFYETLVECKSLSEAVAAGRRKLYGDPYRESVVGELKLRDWMVPCLYQQKQFVPIPERLPVSEIKDTVFKIAKEVCPEGRFGFVGRDYNILDIERKLVKDETPWVLITGVGGCGKTALAYGFARWYAETGGCPGGVFVSSFKEKADFGQVRGSIAGFGTDFSRFPEEEQWELIISYLHTTPCLLIWDNFEPVAGYPEGAEPLAGGEERKRLSQFLKALRRGKSRVLITTRKLNEDWLDVAYHLVSLKGLTERDSARLAESILETVGKKPEDFRDDPEYSRLLTLLRGHPRSLEVVLPHLRDKSPTRIIEGLQHHIDELRDVLDASLTYVFPLLSEQAQKHLPLIGLFTSYVHGNVVHRFSESEHTGYKEMMGESPNDEGWKAILKEAASVGLIRSLGDVYELHPTFPLFLRQRLASSVGKDSLKHLDSAFMNFYGNWAASIFGEIMKASRNALLVVETEKANLLRALRLAEMNKVWRIVHCIVQTLHAFYEARCLFSEWNALRERLFSAVGNKLHKGVNRDKANLLVFLLSTEVNTALKLNQLENATSILQQINDYLISLDDSSVESQIAIVCYLRGRIAQEKQQFDEAEDWYKKALEIFGQLEQDIFIAHSCHQLGMIAQERHQFDEADAWYKRAAEVFEGLGFNRFAANSYHQLGMIAQERHRLDEAEDWYNKALETRKRMQLYSDAATDCHQLGMIAQKRHQLDEAEGWYKKALEIRERLGLERDAATDYHQIGRIAQERHRLDEAKDWYRRALEIRERLGLERDAATDYHNLGTIAQERRQLDKAERLYKQALEMKKNSGLEQDAISDYHQLGTIAYERRQFDKAERLHREALEIAKRLKLKQYIGGGYHQLGMIAQKRHQLDEAEDWYKKALETYRSLGHPPYLVNTLIQLGIFYRERKQLTRSIEWLGEALRIALDYQMRICSRILEELGKALRIMGEKEFTRTWQHSFNEDPPLKDIREIMKKLEE